ETHERILVGVFTLNVVSNRVREDTVHRNKVASRRSGDRASRHLTDARDHVVRGAGGLERLPRLTIVGNGVRQVLRAEQGKRGFPLSEPTRRSVTSVKERTVVNVIRLGRRGERGVLPRDGTRDVDARIDFRCRGCAEVGNARDWNNPDRHITVARKSLISHYATTEKLVLRLPVVLNRAPNLAFELSSTTSTGLSVIRPYKETTSLPSVANTAPCALP